MITLDEHLKVDSCPDCMVDQPNMYMINIFDTKYDNGDEPKRWGVYVCKRCGGSVLALTYPPNTDVVELFPEPQSANMALPEKARTYLTEAIETVSKPSASIMVCASSVDAMLKDRGLTDGSLYHRIDEAVIQGLLTKEMGLWAHQIRLDANDQRHADLFAQLPTVDDAKRCVEFAKTLGEILFVLPARVTRGINNTAPITSLAQNSKPLKPIQPKALKLPPAYRNGGYSAPVNLENSKTKPSVTAKIYYTQNGNKLPETHQPEEFIVINRPGNPKAWITDLVIKSCQGYPETSFVEILVDGQVRHAGNLQVNKSTSAK